MTLVPIRDIGKLGVNTDWSPVDLPISTFTMATNCRFVDNRIRRGPVFSKIGNLGEASPKSSLSYKLVNGTSQFFVLNDNGTITKFQASVPGSPPTLTDYTTTGWSPNASTSQYTSVILNDVVYVNRSDHVPWYLTSIGTKFASLPVWDANWRCESLRSISGVLVAINITKSGTRYPTMVKTSDFTTYGSTPGAWTASSTNSATENIISDLQDPLVDGWPLRDRMVLYANTETWVMEYRGDSQVFGYKRLFNNRGVISQNCVAEYNNTHYVFGLDDIWTHDGYQQKSISLGRVRDFIYNNMVRSEANQFFVVNNAKQGEIMFCYVSTDQYCHYPALVSGSYPGCNRAAVYNYNYDTWYFYDMPYAVSGSLGIAFSGATYVDTASLTYDAAGGNFNSLFDASRLYLNMVCRYSTHPSGSLAASVRMFEARNISSGLTELEANANAPVFIENKMMDMDDVAKELRGYKVVTQMWPEGTFEYGASPVTFYWGSSDYPNVLPTYYESMLYDGYENYKLDFKSAGRYLSIKMIYDGIEDFSMSGFDVDYQIFGHR